MAKSQTAARNESNTPHAQSLRGRFSQGIEQETAFRDGARGRSEILCFRRRRLERRRFNACCTKGLSRSRLLWPVARDLSLCFNKFVTLFLRCSGQKRHLHLLQVLECGCLAVAILIRDGGTFDFLTWECMRD